MNDVDAAAALEKWPLATGLHVQLLAGLVVACLVPPAQCFNLQGVIPQKAWGRPTPSHATQTTNHRALGR
jgi:hypothetical protein